MGTLLVMGSTERVGAGEELLGYWTGVNGEWIVVGWMTQRQGGPDL